MIHLKYTQSSSTIVFFYYNVGVCRITYDTYYYYFDFVVVMNKNEFGQCMKVVVAYTITH